MRASLARLCTQAAFALRKKDLKAAKSYLEDVLKFKRAIPFRRFNGGVGRSSQANNERATGGQARLPVKSAEFLLNLLKNAESNAEARVWWGGAGSGAAAAHPPRARCPS